MQSPETAMTYDMQSTPKDVVPPGCQTGTYYIPISNLPFNASWQQLKDYVRQACTVDHVVIFPKSTSGWVRVKGPENFRAAFEQLNGKEFNGRALIADDRNRDRPVKIRDLMVAGQGQGAASVDHSVEGSSTAISTTTAGPETPRYATGGPVSYPSSSSMYTSPTTTASSAFSQGGGYPGSTDASSHMASSGSYYSHSSAPSYDSSVGYPQTSQPIHNYSYAQDSSSYYGFAPPPTIQDQQQYAVQGYNNDFYPSESSYGHQPTASGMGDFSMPAYASTSPQQFGAVGGVVYTEQRGIHIREISRRASDDQVRKMIRDAVGSDSDLITEIEVPLDKDRTPRGWATAHFRSAEMAQRMVRQLNRYEFKGRPLQVRLLKEGETIGTSIGGGHQSSSQSSSRHNGSSSKHHHSSSSRKDDGRKDRGHKEKTVAPNTHAKASGSSLFSSTSSSSKDKGKGKEKDSGSTSSKKAVVIADGSSGRKHRSS